jgi:hypothetical protein
VRKKVASTVFDRVRVDDGRGGFLTIILIICLTAYSCTLAPNFDAGSTTLGLQVLQVPYGTNSSEDARSRHIVIGETPFRWLRLKPAKTASGNTGMSGDIVIAWALRHRTCLIGKQLRILPRPSTTLRSFNGERKSGGRRDTQFF